MLKKCNRCKERKILSSFTIDRQKYDEMSIYCKDCKRIINKKYNATHVKENAVLSKKWRSENAEYDAERQREYYDNNKEVLLVYSKKYQKEHPESSRRSSLKYYKKNTKKAIAYAKKYYADNAEKIKANSKIYSRKYYAENSEELKRKAREKYRKNKNC